MRIINEMITKKLENEKIYLKAKKNYEAMQEHISAYLLALAYLNKKDKETNKKYLYIIKLLKNDEKALEKLLVYKKEEKNIILQAIKKMEDEQEQSSENMYSLFDTYTWAILSYEHEFSR